MIHRTNVIESAT